MNLYALIEPVILALIVVFGFWMTLRKVTPKLSLKLSRAARHAGLPDKWADRIFGPIPKGACGTCCGCEKGSASDKASKIRVHKAH